MKIQSVKEGVKKMAGKGRLLVAGAAASAVSLMYSAALYAQDTGLDTLGEKAGEKIDGLASQLVGPGLAVVGIAVGIATVAVVLRLTKKA